MAIILRSSKSIPLTFTEMDGNFSELNARTTTLENSYIKSINGVTTSSAQDNAITLDSDNITQGSTNIYFTNAAARSAISITDAGGDGSLSYNSTTGVITYTGPSAAEVRTHISATSATGVTYTAGTGVIALASIPNSSLTNSSITLEGDSGSDTVALGSTLRITGGSGLDTAEASGVVTVGITADGVNNTHIDFGTGANQVSTADIPEQTNLYYTDVRADARIAAANLTDLNDVTYSSPTTNHVLTWTGSEWQPAEAPGATGGEANQMSNVGGYNEIFKQKVGVSFQLRTIDHGDNLSITQSTDTLTINTVAAPEFGNIKIGGNSIENIATNSNIALVPNGTGVVTTDSDLLPAADSSYDLGAIGTEWANAYVDTVTATNIGGTLTTGAQGNVTSLGTQTSDLNMGSNKITSVTDPTSAQDAATKAYVDNATSSTTTVTGDSGSDSFVVGDSLTFNGTANEVDTAVTVGGSGPVVTIGLPTNVTVSNDLTVGNALTVTGNLTVNGTTTTVSSTELAINDGKIQLAVNNESSDTVDIGFVGHYNNGVRRAHAGLFRDATDKKFKLMGDYGPEPNQSTIDTNDANFALADLVLRSLEIGDTDNPSMAIRGSRLETINSNQNIELETSGTGIVDIGTDVRLKAQADLRFADSDSSNYVAFQAPATVASNVTWTLPAADAGVSGYALVSDAAGTLSFAAAGATVSADTSTNTEFLVYFASTTTGALTAVKQDSGLTYNPSTGTLTSGVFSGAGTGLTGTAASLDIGGNAGTATALETARTIGGVSFDGTAAINLPGVNTGGNQDTSGNAATATLASTVTITANNTANETVYLTFVDGATGTQGLETDTGLSYNPSTNVLSTTASAAQYADLAEIYATDHEYAPGTVVTVGGDAEVTAANPEAKYIAGVISTAPAYLMNSAANGEAVALVGRVPVRVVGSINKGEAVFATHNGKASSNGAGPIVGIALESNSDLGEKLIECLLKV
jgi:hypothetical protein